MLFAVYGSPRSYYGNIQYGQAAPRIQTYGGWPDTHPNIQDDPRGWSNKPVEPPPRPTQTAAKESIPPEITENSAIINRLRADLKQADDIESRRSLNIAIIKRLRAELENAEDAGRRRFLRKQIEDARKEKERHFRRQAMIDDRDEAFILFH